MNQSPEIILILMKIFSKKMNHPIKFTLTSKNPTINRAERAIKPLSDVNDYKITKNFFHKIFARMKKSL